jgi:shikimate dehydrogenase
MYPKTKRTVATRKILPSGMVVFDIVYNPVKTLLLSEAEAAGAKTITGVGMLVHQGAEAFKIWTGHSPPLDVMRRAVMKELSGL